MKTGFLLKPAKVFAAPKHYVMDQTVNSPTPSRNLSTPFQNLAWPAVDPQTTRSTSADIVSHPFLENVERNEAKRSLL